MRRTAVETVLITMILGLQPAAQAGGWWSSIDFGGRYLVSGARSVARTEVMFHTIAAAEEARAEGRFYVYLIPDFDWRHVHRSMSRPWAPGWWESPGPGAVQVGEVTFTGWNANIARARAEFVVPEIQPGTYAAMLCDLGCNHALADLIPTRLKIVDSPFSKELAQRLDRVSSDLRAQMHSLREAAERSISDLRGNSADYETVVAVDERMGQLKERIDSLARRADKGPAWPIYTLVFLAGAAICGVVLLLMRRGTDHVSVEQALDMELKRELARSSRP